MDFGRSGKMGEKRQKNGNIGIFYPFFANFSIFRPLFSHFPGAAKIHFSAIFFPFPFQAGGPTWGLYQAIRIAKQKNILRTFPLVRDFRYKVAANVLEHSFGAFIEKVSPFMPT